MLYGESDFTKFTKEQLIERLEEEIKIKRFLHQRFVDHQREIDSLVVRWMEATKAGEPK